MKVALIVLEGMADRSQTALGRATPLQVAATPNLDRLAGLGACGQLYPLAPGVCPTSDLALWHLLGYGSLPYPGRAAVEALGAGIELQEGEAAFRVVLATTMVDEGRRYVQVAPAYLAELQAAELARALAQYKGESFEARLHHLGGPFMVLVLAGGASVEVTDSDPRFYRLPVPAVQPLAGAEAAAAATARELQRFTAWAAEVLAAHRVNRARSEEGMPPIDYVLLQWPSRKTDVPPFVDAWGFDGAACGGGIFLEGLARMLALAPGTGGEPPVPEAKDPGDELANRLEQVLHSFAAGRDFALVLNRAADEASHSGKPSRKVRVIEELDGALAMAVDAFATDADMLTLVTTGYTAPGGGSDEVIHSGDPVPLVAVGGSVRVDGVTAFDELACAAGSLGTLTGEDLMPVALNLADRARLAGSRITAADRPWRPLR